eukprot:2474010-Ditylum_brightwellii.AAC.1
MTSRMFIEPHIPEGLIIFNFLLNRVQTKRRQIVTAMWQGEKVPAIHVIIPPASPEDETTNEGVAK